MEAGSPDNGPALQTARDTVGDGGGASAGSLCQLPVGLCPLPALGLHVFLRTVLKCPVYPMPVLATEALPSAVQPGLPCGTNSFGTLQEQIFPEVRSRQGQGSAVVADCHFGDQPHPVSFHC